MRNPLKKYQNSIPILWDPFWDYYYYTSSCLNYKCESKLEIRKKPLWVVCNYYIAFCNYIFLVLNPLSVL